MNPGRFRRLGEKRGIHEEVACDVEEDERSARGRVCSGGAAGEEGRGGQKESERT